MAMRSEKESLGTLENRCCFTILETINFLKRGAFVCFVFTAVRELSMTCNCHVSALTNRVATSHMWLWSTWRVVRMAEELSFTFYFILVAMCGQWPLY